MAQTKNALISILGSSYCQPIADLIEQWMSRPQPKSNTVKSSLLECGYAASVVLLLVAMFESYVVRVRHIRRAPPKLRTALEVLFHLYPRLRHRKALKDVYVLRDTIFHNHLWEIEYSCGSSGIVLRGAVRNPAFGDKKYFVRVNPKTRRTKALGLSVVPIRVDRRDARRVFQTVWKTLLFLEYKNRNQCYVSQLDVRFCGKIVLFGNLVRRL